MLPGGVTEVLWHFVGHLRIVDDIARERVVYDDAPIRTSSEDYVTPRPTFDYKPDIDELASRGLRTPELHVPDESSPNRIPPPKLAPAPADPELDLLGVDSSQPLRGAGGGGGGGGGSVKIVVRYEDGGEQTQLQIRQYNINSDNDLLVLIEMALKVMPPF